MKATQEQQYAIEAARTGESLVLEAMAGTGKSTTLKMIANGMPGKRMLYTAFSAAVIADAKEGGFGQTRIQSNHSLAYASYGAGYRNAGRMERRLTPKVVSEFFNLSDKSYPSMLNAETVAHLALESVFRFQQSADTALNEGNVHLPGSIAGDMAGEFVMALAERIWAEMCNPASRLPVTHDTYLKRWALSNPRLPYNTILLDEGQDANGVIVDVLSKQDAQLIVVGDANQQIFSWRGAVNAMDAFGIEKRARLTQSFRFGNTIAEAANGVLAMHCNTEAVMRGNPAIDDRIGTFDSNGPFTEIARTNATLIGRVTDCIRHGKVAVVGGVGDLLKLVEGAERLQQGQLALTCPDLMDFRDWGEVKSYAETESGRDLSVLVRLVNDYGTYRLKSILGSVKDNEKDEARCDVILTTAHRAKGREWDRVLLHDDFPVPQDADLRWLNKGKFVAREEKPSKWNPEEANLLYVAVTRAKKVLNAEKCAAWGNAVEHAVNHGFELPGITDDVRFNPDAKEKVEVEVERQLAEDAEAVEAEAEVHIGMATEIAQLRKIIESAKQALAVERFTKAHRLALLAVLSEV